MGGEAVTLPGSLPGMEDSARRPHPVSSALISLCVVAGQHQRTADPMQLARALGWDPGAPLTDEQLLIAAKELGLKAKIAHSTWDRLARHTLPVIAGLTDGGYIVLLRCDPDGHVLAGDPRASRPQPLSREQLEGLWSGKLVLIKSRLRLDNPNRPFDLSWFVPAIWKYRRILACSFMNPTGACSLGFGERPVSSPPRHFSQRPAWPERSGPGKLPSTRPRSLPPGRP